MRLALCAPRSRVAEPGNRTPGYKRPGFHPWIVWALVCPADEFSWNFLTWSDSIQMGGSWLSGSSVELTPIQH